MILRRIIFSLAAGALSLSAQFPEFKPSTPLLGAALTNNVPEVKRLLAAGANPNEGAFFGAPPIFLGLFNHNNELVKLMVEKGANVNAVDASGRSEEHTSELQS